MANSFAGTFNGAINIGAGSGGGGGMALATEIVKLCAAAMEMTSTIMQVAEAGKERNEQNAIESIKNLMFCYYLFTN